MRTMSHPLPAAPVGGCTLRCYLLAMRLPFLLASAVPVALGWAAAHHDGHTMTLWIAVVTLLGALLAHAATNVLNDGYDSDGDAINQGFVAPYTGGSRLIQQGVLSEGQMRRYGYALLAAAALCGLLLLSQGGLWLWLVGLAGLLLGWAYSAPPLALASRGLGELAAGLGVGTLIPLGSYLVQSGEPAWTPLLAGLPYVLLAANLLVINQFPDRVADEAVGKRHWVVRLGARRGRWLYIGLALSAWLSLPAMVLLEWLPASVLLALPLALCSLLAARQLWRYAEQPQRLAGAIRYTIAALLGGGGLIALGLGLMP